MTSDFLITPSGSCIRKDTIRYMWIERNILFIQTTKFSFADKQYNSYVEAEESLNKIKEKLKND